MMLPPGHAYFTPPDWADRAQDFGALDAYHASIAWTESAVSRTNGTPAVTADAGMSFMLRACGYIGSLPSADCADTVAHTSAHAAKTTMRVGLVMMATSLSGRFFRSARRDAAPGSTHGPEES